MSHTSAPVELTGLQVSLDKLLYRRLTPQQSDRPHSFIYFISIHNNSDVAVTIKGRKWVVTDDLGETLVVEGDGVVGQTPTIPPGDKFEYNSKHLLKANSAVAEGAYLGLDEKGRRVIVRIPKFRMTVPKGTAGEV